MIEYSLSGQAPTTRCTQTRSKGYGSAQTSVWDQAVTVGASVPEPADLLGHP
jgi:hypothetical protein